MSARGARIRALAGLNDDLEVIKRLGNGAFGSAHLVRQRSSGEMRVLKAIRKQGSSVPPEQVSQEIAVLKAMDHPSIIRIFGHYEDSRFVYILMEPAQGGELLAVIKEIHEEKKAQLSEAWAAQVFQQCISAVAYCHARGVMHKDLKSENIMLLGKDCYAHPHAVIIDFGVSELVTPRSNPGGLLKLRGRLQAGTCTTMAPGVWRGDFGPKCDVWSLGCVLFRVLSGQLPFMAKNMDDASEWLRLQAAGPDWNILRKVSPEAIGLCKRMLAYDERVRPTAQQCLGHRWFSHAPQAQLDPEILQALCEFQEQNMTERNVYLDLVSCLNTAHVQHLTALFRACDADASGTLSPRELFSALRKAGIDERQAQKAAEQVQRSGRDMEYSHFLAATVSVCEDLLEEVLWREFSKIDPTGNARFGPQDLSKVLGGLGLPNAEAAVSTLPLGTDGRMGFDDLADHFSRSAPGASSRYSESSPASVGRSPRLSRLTGQSNSFQLTHQTVGEPKTVPPAPGVDSRRLLSPDPTPLKRPSQECATALLTEVDSLLEQLDGGRPDRDKPHKQSPVPPVPIGMKNPLGKTPTESTRDETTWEAPPECHVPTRVADALFAAADPRNKGALGPAELARWVQDVMASPIMGIEAHEIQLPDFRAADTNADGRLDRAEWQRFVEAIAEVTGVAALEKFVAMQQAQQAQRCISEKLPAATGKISDNPVDAHCLGDLQDLDALLEEIAAA